MKRTDELVAEIEALQAADLERWVAEAWVVPTHQDDLEVFSEMECARIRLICTLVYELDVEEETLPIVLSLLDQLYATRRQLRALTNAVSTQNRAVQDAIMRALNRTRADWPPQS